MSDDKFVHEKFAQIVSKIRELLIGKHNDILENNLSELELDKLKYLQFEESAEFVRERLPAKAYDEFAWLTTTISIIQALENSPEAQRQLLKDDDLLTRWE